MKSIPWGLASLCFACAALLAACGGGGDSGRIGGGGDGGGDGAGTPATVDNDTNMMSNTDVPLSATTSSAGAMEFVKRMAATRDDSAEPIRVGDAILATSDTDEPDPDV